jgi:hypothetical protein
MSSVKNVLMGMLEIFGQNINIFLQNYKIAEGIRKMLAEIVSIKDFNQNISYYQTFII